MEQNLRFLCIASFFKGEDFIRGCKQAGCTVYLLTSQKHEHKNWPRESIDEMFYVVDDNDLWNMDDVVAGLAHVFRTRKIDRIVALDDFDVEKAAFLREHFRIPGMGQTTARYFRDKLAMRIKAADDNISVPQFTSLFNDDDINAYAQSVAPPWLIKPRSEASATGIQKCYTLVQLWEGIHRLKDKRHEYLLEQFRPGDVYHVDSLIFNKKIVFSKVSKYLTTPMDVAHDGGIFRSCTLKEGTAEEKTLQKMNVAVLKSFGLNYSASHTEFIKCHEDGKFYFLETASRVGGANLAEMVEAASGINIWREWASIEAAVARNENYTIVPTRKDYAGIVVSLSRFEHPDTSSFQEDEIVWRMQKDYHIGLIVRASLQAKVLELLDKYAERIQKDYHATAPVPNKSSS